VTGGVMVIGLKYGSAKPGETTQKAKVAEVVRQFLAEFKARHGSIVCRDLLGHDIGTPEGNKAAIELGLYKSVCTPLIKSAAEILEGILSAPVE